MKYEIYRVNNANVSLPKNTHMSARTVEYLFKAIGNKKWYAVLDNGGIVPVVSVDHTKIIRVGSLCKFHSIFSNSICRHFKYENHPLIQAGQRDERHEIMNSRKTNKDRINK